jgi:hypothetical protein
MVTSNAAASPRRSAAVPAVSSRSTARPASPRPFQPLLHVDLAAARSWMSAHAERREQAAGQEDVRAKIPGAGRLAACA